ncbi:hypothetical protein D187_008715 [Cystobacter fuscus DSM 2262]|uniref:Uncharacterized protein n=1 Tax=Cystobacter fuscus (strain ATCC 25194 / DSM 2262 / NBRC 100088 / M29) TaxID=1242864 RepID=S9PJD7_CYSF2|nr:hypothetical protein D187_008715 [Cystobacter fuscus DSM 2262]
MAAFTATHPFAATVSVFPHILPRGAAWSNPCARAAVALGASAGREARPF